MKAKRPCTFCGRTVAVRHDVQAAGGGKARVPHNCLHGFPCLSGNRLAGQQGNNPGGVRHKLACAKCAAEAASGQHPGSRDRTIIGLKWMTGHSKEDK